MRSALPLPFVHRVGSMVLAVRPCTSCGRSRRRGAPPGIGEGTYPNKGTDAVVNRKSAKCASIERARPNAPPLGRAGAIKALNDYQREEAARRLAEGESAPSVARLLGVSHVTVAKLRVA